MNTASLPGLLAASWPSLPAVDAARLGRAATVALYDELALAPKPGLVSFIDNGSHSDMGAAILLRSLFALRHYFVAITAAGGHGAAFDELQQLGIAAEAAMLRATGGVNTHRGAIFSLGLLCAAAGRAQSQGLALRPDSVRAQLLGHWGPALTARCQAARSASNGQTAARRFGLRSVGDEAALGFPVLFETTLPALQQALAQGLDARHSRLQALFETLAVLDDTNLAHRGGLAGLRWAQGRASGFLAQGGAARPDALARAQALHAEFVARRLSPGGSADLLAAACWLQRVASAP